MKLSLLMFTILFFSLSSSTFACVDPDKTFAHTGFAWLDGGYENLVGTGIVKAKNGKKLRVIFGGGNHASGDLGATFPWIQNKGKELTGLGFNDMMIRIGDRQFYYSDTFKKSPTSRDVNKILKATKLTPYGKIHMLEFDLPVMEVGTYQKSIIELTLHVVQGEKISRKEGLKRFNNSKLLTLIQKLFRIRLDKNLGLALEEHPLSLDPSERSEIRLYNYNATKLETYEFESFFGGLEKSSIHIYASKEKDLHVHMKYDYVGLYPESQECSQKGMVGYISGLLNKDQKPVNKLWSWMFKLFKLPTLQKEMHKFARTFGSSAFMYDADGNETDIPFIQLYDKFETIEDLSRVPQFNLTKEGRELMKLTHTLGPGTFHRKLIEVKGRNGCMYYGMLEIQTLN